MARHRCKASGLLRGLFLAAVCAGADSSATTTVLFGSCNRLHMETPIWAAIADRAQETSAVAWIWGGDNMYADTRHHCLDLLLGRYICQRYVCEQQQRPISARQAF